MDINWVTLLLGGVISAGISGTCLLWNQQLERNARRKELLFTAAKDIALEIHKTEREKYSTLQPIPMNISTHYAELKHIIDNDGKLSPEMQKQYEDSLKDPLVQASLKNDGYKPNSFNIDPKKAGLVNKNLKP